MSPFSILIDPGFVGTNYPGHEADLRSYMVESGLKPEHVDRMFNNMLDIGGYTDERVNGFSNEYEYRKSVFGGWGQAIFAMGGGGAITFESYSARQLASRLALRPLARTAGAEGMALAESAAVQISGRTVGARWRSYEEAIRNLYGAASYSARRFETVVNGRVVAGVADDVARVNGQNLAVEAKYVENWAASIANPASRIGGRDFAVRVQQRIVAQATKYSSHFDQVVYHTNSAGFARYYSQVFSEAGLNNVRFVITPAAR